MFADAAVPLSRESVDITPSSAGCPTPSFLLTEAGYLAETSSGVVPSRCHLLAKGSYLQVWGDASRFYYGLGIVWLEREWLRG